MKKKPKNYLANCISEEAFVWFILYVQGILQLNLD